MGEDGKCVICRRGEEVVEAKTSSDWPVVVFVLGVGALLVGGVGWWLVDKIQSGSPGAGAEISPAPAPPPEPAAAATEERRSTPRSTDEFPSILASASSSAAPPPTPEAEEAALAAAMKKVPITVYRKTRCTQCDRARLQMQREGWTFQELDVDASQTDLVLLKAANPSGSVPTFDVGGEILVGYDKAALRDAVAEQAKKKLPAPPKQP